MAQRQEQGLVEKCCVKLSKRGETCPKQQPSIHDYDYDS